jgi:hypothetical protein
MREIMIRLIAALLLLPGTVWAQGPTPVSDAFKGSMIVDALEWRKLMLNDSSTIDVCSVSRIVGHSQEIMKRVTDRIGAARFKGTTGVDCVPLPLGDRPGGISNTLVFQDFDFAAGISDSVARSYNLDRNPQNRAGLASLTVLPIGTGGYGHGHVETYTFAIMQDGPGGRHVFRFFLDVKFHHFGM